MAMELYVPARGGPGTSHGIVGALTKTTINNIVVRIGDIVEFVHQDKRVSGLVVKDHYSKKPIIWGLRHCTMVYQKTMYHKSLISKTEI